MLSHLGKNLRKKRFGNFRKANRNFNYKRTGAQRGLSHPGAMDVQVKMKLLKMRTLEAAQRIKEMEIKEDRIFGKFDNFGNFYYDKSKVPEYDIPQIDNFELKPYVSYSTPKISQEMMDEIKSLNNFEKVN